MESSAAASARSCSIRSSGVSTSRRISVERQSLLLRLAAEASDQRRNAARLDLARFYLARGFDAEAKGVLDLTLGDGRRTAEDVPALVLRGVTEIKLEHPDDALKDLSNPLVGNQYDAPLWRAMAHTQQGKYAEAREGFKNVAAVIGTLPIELQRLALQKALLALHRGAGLRRRR